MGDIDIAMPCPYCDGQIDMSLSGLNEGAAVYCPYCGSILGYACVKVTLSLNIVEEDSEYFEAWCIHCANLLPDNCCKLQPGNQRARYAHTGCRFTS